MLSNFAFRYDPSKLHIHKARGTDLKSVPSGFCWSSFSATWAISLAVTLFLLVGPVVGEGHAAKSRVKGKPPALKIISVDPAPIPFLVPAEAPLTLTIMVELPKTLPEDTVLDVTTLITSRSKSSIRVLASRQTVPNKAVMDSGDLPRIEIIQTWDGTDQTKRVVTQGRYDYLVQAKLLVNGGKTGAVTRTTSWRKRGSIEVKTR